MILTPWTTVESGDRAANAPATANLALALRDDAEHDRMLVYDPDRHAPADGEAHRHRGDDSSHVAGIVPNMPNLVSRPYSHPGKWQVHGATDNTGGWAFAAGGQWATICLGDTSRTWASLGVFGSGSHLVLSGYARADRTLTAGSLQMGLSTGGSKDDEDERAFIAGGSMVIPFALFSTSWRRFWCVIDTDGMEFTQSIRFGVQCASSPLAVGAYMLANLFDVRAGRVLDYPVPGYGTTTSRYGSLTFGLGNKDWAGWGYAPSGGPPPPYDHAIAITNAIQLAPV